MLTRISSVLRRGQPLNRSFARSCLILNILGLPGMGSLLAGRVSSIFQILLAVIAGCLLTFFLFAYAWDFLNAGGFIPVPSSYAWTVTFGIPLFIISWVWAFFTGLSILRQADHDQE
jgi:hypothetical protein